MEANRPVSCPHNESAYAEAKVAWPHRSSSTTGVNQRRSKSPSARATTKSCFAVTVLRCDFLHDIIGRKCGNETYTRRIACKQFVREGIDVVIRNWHAHQSITGKNRLLGGWQLGNIHVRG